MNESGAHSIAHRSERKEGRKLNLQCLLDRVHRACRRVGELRKRGGHGGIGHLRGSGANGGRGVVNEAHLDLGLQGKEKKGKERRVMTLDEMRGGEDGGFARPSCANI